MTKEYEFRAFISAEYIGEEKGIMCTGDSPNDFQMMIDFNGITMVDDDYHYVPDEHFSIMEFTGLLDVDGVKVFKGDILRCEHNFVWVVGFISGCFVAYKAGNDSEFAFLNEWDFKVIGNIDENPELLASQ